MKKVLIMGAAGRDFHNFNVFFRDNPDYGSSPSPPRRSPISPAASTPRPWPASSIPRASPSTPRPRWRPHRRPEGRRTSSSPTPTSPTRTSCTRPRRRHGRRRRLHAAGPRRTPWSSPPSPSSPSAPSAPAAARARPPARWPRSCSRPGKKVVAIRHPMPYGDLVKQKVQRFATYADLDKHKCTIEEREEYEPHIDKRRDHLRRRRLRGHPAPGREGSRRHPLGRRQQRLPLLQVGPRDRRGRPAPPRPRGDLLPRRDQLPPGRRHRDQQDRHGQPGRHRRGRAPTCTR